MLLISEAAEPELAQPKFEGGSGIGFTRKKNLKQNSFWNHFSFLVMLNKINKIKSFWGLSIFEQFLYMQRFRDFFYIV